MAVYLDAFPSMKTVLSGKHAIAPSTGVADAMVTAGCVTVGIVTVGVEPVAVTPVAVAVDVAEAPVLVTLGVTAVEETEGVLVLPPVAMVAVCDVVAHVG